MKMKFTIQGAVIALFMITGITKAQYMCTDVVPDVTVTLPPNTTLTTNTDIDLNNDATFDFRITSAQSGTLGFVIAQAGVIGTNNFVMVDGSNNALALNVNTSIGSASTIWHQMNASNPSMTTVFGPIVSGSWGGATDKYLGLQLVVGANTYYGWARFTFSPIMNSYVYKDYGYNATASQSIAAGQTCSVSSFIATFSLASTVCNGHSVNVTANTGTFAASGYTWSANPAGPIFSAPNASTSSITFNAAGFYTIALTATSGTNISTATHTIGVVPNPTVTIASNNSTVICSGQAAVLTGSGAVSYAWNTGPTTSTLAISPTVTTSYTLTGSNLGCTNTAVFTQSIINCSSGLTQLNSLENGFMLFPNPASDKLAIKSNYESQKELDITMTNAIGKIVLQQHLKFVDQESIQYLNLSTLSKGIYFVKMNTSNGGSKVVRIIKE